MIYFTKIMNFLIFLIILYILYENFKSKANNCNFFMNRFFFSIWGIERSGFFNGREKWAKGFENQRV